MKASASKDRKLLHHRGSACVFENTADMANRIDSPDLEVDANSVLILKSIGPVGNPGMPEAGLIPIPQKLGKQGVTDMLRISDGRMSGTAGGTIILHISPESADLDSVFGVVQTGDKIICDVEKRTLLLEVEEQEIARRIADRKTRSQVASASGKADGQMSHNPEPWVERAGRRGYRGLYEREVNQAHLGCDFGFLTAKGPSGT
ncbi:hypothetical protein CLAIMM_00977 [Cladophialophora immunda]|nr:hypothetical protein CLAIMM_00977 [Cladophialophora immunda]